MKTLHIPLIALGIAGFVLPADSVSAQDELVCPSTSTPSSYGTGTLNTRTDVKDGIWYEEKDTIGSLSLHNEGANFWAPLAPIPHLPDPLAFVAKADFNGDSFDDVVGGRANGQTYVYRNNSAAMPGPTLFEDWFSPVYDPTLGFGFVRDAQFLNAYSLGADAGGNHHMVLATGDFNGDGKPDIFRANSNMNSAPVSAQIWLNNSVAVGSISFAAPYNALATGTLPADLGVTAGRGSNVAVADYNGDRKLDLLVGSAETTGGSIRIFLNTCTLVAPLPDPAPALPAPLPCASAPQFTYAGALIENMNMEGNGPGEMPAFAYADVDGDNVPDLIAGSPRCCTNPMLRLRIWRGVLGGGISTTPQSLDADGAISNVLVGDITHDGLPDIVITTADGYYAGAMGGQAWFYRNNGTTNPFSGYDAAAPTDYPTKIDWDYNYSFTPPTTIDVALLLNLDGDPHKRLDFFFGGGFTTDEFQFKANRPWDFFVSTGDAISDPIDLGGLASSELVVTGARLDPEVTPDPMPPCTTPIVNECIEWYVSNEEPPNWIKADPCVDNPKQFCASFPNQVGREVRWKARLRADSTSYARPGILGLSMTFDYKQAKDHVRGGIIVHDGVAYIPAFRQPGDRGKLYAVSAGLSTPYWEAGRKLDAMNDVDRRIYTTATDGTTRLEFRLTGSPTNDEPLRISLGATDALEADAVISWVRSARFGIGNPGIPVTRLGAIENSTPAVVATPGLPPWYTMSGADDRQAVDAFNAAYANRIPLVIFGAMSGMIHAIRNQATNITDVRNGTEVWAFVPRTIASRMLADYTNSQAAGKTLVTAFPDASPSVATARVGGQMRTVLVMGNGQGGKSIAALDVTNTIDPATNVVSGPTPLWNATPGEGEAGNSHIKPAILRVRINNQERFIAVAGTGRDASNSDTMGRIVAAYDIANGTLLWKFQAKCTITSDITGFETDDEPGTRLDGHIERVVFADKCGYLYKVDPGKDLSGGWNANAGIGGTIAVDVVDGKQLYALFATAISNPLTPPPSNPLLGQQRPITGNIAARTDVSGRMVLFFGTGGRIEDPTTVQNALYGIYADTGEVRDIVPGTCTGAKCEKFYGGVTVANDQIIYTRSVDPSTGAGTCDLGSASIEARTIDSFDTLDFAINRNSAIQGSVFVRAGALFAATVGGEIISVGASAADQAGEESGGVVTNPTTGQGTLDRLVLMGWRQIY